MPIETINEAWDDVQTIDGDLSQGHVSIQEASAAVNDINKGWNDFADNLNQRIGFDAKAWAEGRFGVNTYEAFGGIKNGAATGISSVSSFFTGVDSFKGSWRNPAEARQKLERGLTQISSGVQSLGETFRNISRTGTAIGNALKGLDNASHPILSGLGSGIGTVSAGIGTFGGNLVSSGEAFVKSGIIGFAGRMTEAISRGVNGDGNELGVATGGASAVGQNNTRSLMRKNGSDSGEQDEEDEYSESQNLNDINENDPKIDPKSKKYGDGGDSFGETNKSDDYSADMISGIDVILDGNSPSQNSYCTISGTKYKLSGYSLSQELLQPVILSFSIEKEDKTETRNDVVFKDVTQLIGKSLEVRVSTIKINKLEDQTSPRDAFIFKGMIINVSASRATASSQSASIIAASWDSLLQNAPHCRSFENMSLKDIVTSVLKPYSEVKPKISPRFKEKIPYIVQYNQSDYAFISMLAIRFGEWMYSTGSEFIFGELEEPNSAAVNLEYPGGSLMSYNLRQNITPFSFNHLMPDHYQYGKEKSILKESAKTVADGKVNDWTNLAYNASQQRYKNEQITALNVGGFDNGKDEEGIDTILEYSLNIEAQGKKTGLMTVNGSSKLAMLNIGQTFMIRDSIQNKSGESLDVEQSSLKVIGIKHNFNYQQDYGNSFVAIPVSCNYPSYSDSECHSVAYSQRAKVVDNEDEQKLGRVRVQFPWQEIQSKEMKTPWLRIAVPYAGASKGHQFIPEIGEEVMVGFEMDNAEKPYIIGTLYNGGKGKPDEEWAASKDDDGTNTVKAIRTRNGHTIEIHDKGNDGYIRIYDNKKENYILTFSTDEKLIKLESTGNIELYAKNDIIMQAGHDIRVQAGHDRNTSVGRNDSLSVGSNQFVKIGANKDEQVANHLQISAQNIRVEAGMSLNEYSTTHNINALAEVSITSTGPTNIKSKILKAN